MKVLFITPTFGLVSRGAEYSTHLQAEGLNKLGVKPMILGNGKSFFKGSYKYKYYNQKKDDYNFEVKNKYYRKILNRLYLTKNNFNFLKFYFLIYKDINNFSPDVIVCGHAISSILTKIFFPKSKILIFGHAGVGFHDFDNLRTEPDLFISLTPKIKLYKRYKRNGTKLVYIPNGVDLNTFKPQLKSNTDIIEKLNLQNHQKVIFCSAALEPYKRVDKLIKACGRLKNIYLIVAGDGEMKLDLINLAKKELGKDRFTISTFKKMEMVDLYNRCDVFVLPSEKNEAFGNVLLEAMACNKPVVANNDEVRAKIVGRGGIITDCGNISNLAESINSVLKTYWGDKPLKQARRFEYTKVAKKISYYINIISS